MINALKCKSGKHHSSARVVDGKLILSFPGALTPVVWQMELAEAKASALEIRESKDKTAHVLTLKTMKGEAVEIAPFAGKAEAVEALVAVAKALEGAQGKIRPQGIVSSGAAESSFPPEKKKGGGKWSATILGLLLIFILMGIWGSLTPHPPAGAQGRGDAAPGMSFGQKQPENGVPLSADEFLQGR